MPTAKSSQLDEILKCGKDPVYFTNRYCKIAHPSKGLIPFTTYPFQDDCMREFKKNRFNIVLKSRQLGLSTITASFALWMAIFQREKNILVIATKMQVAQNFVSKVKTMMKSLPAWLMIPTIVNQTKTLISFSNGSTIKAIGTSEDAGRSEALSLLIVDEAAFIRNFGELWKGLYPTLATGGSAIILSTPNGVGNQYHKLWVDAENESSSFNAIKLPWDVHPERDEKWFESECRNMTKKQIAQELLCDFASSGDTFLNIEEMEKIRVQSRLPIETWGPDKGVWVWKYPIQDHKYVLTADVSRGDASDFSTIQVIDTDESEQVLEFKGKIPPDQFGILIYEIGIKYNKALVCPESNSYGYATITKLKDMGYPSLFVADKRFSYAMDVPASKIGFTTNQNTKIQALTKLEEYLRTAKIRIYSSRLCDEFRTFMWFGDTARSQKGYNDDLIMALAISCTLFEPNLSVAGRSMNVHAAMIKAMAVNTKQPPPQPTLNPFSNGSTDQRFVTQPKYVGNLPPEFSWLFK